MVVDDENIKSENVGTYLYPPHSDNSWYIRFAGSKSKNKPTKLTAAERSAPRPSFIVGYVNRRRNKNNIQEVNNLDGRQMSAYQPASTTADSDGMPPAAWAAHRGLFRSIGFHHSLGRHAFLSCVKDSDWFFFSVSSVVSRRMLPNTTASIHQRAKKNLAERNWSQADCFEHSWKQAKGATTVVCDIWEEIYFAKLFTNETTYLLCYLYVRFTQFGYKKCFQINRWARSILLTQSIIHIQLL